MVDKRESWHYKTVPCCSCCTFCKNITYNDDWGAQHFSECPIIANKVDPNGICDGYQAGKPKSETRSVTYQEFLWM